MPLVEQAAVVPLCHASCFSVNNSVLLVYLESGSPFLVNVTPLSLYWSLQRVI